MKTAIWLKFVIKGQSGIHAMLHKELDLPFLCPTGLTIEDPALHRKDSRLRVCSASLSTREPLVCVWLEDFEVDDREQLGPTIGAFKGAGWVAAD